MAGMNVSIAIKSFEKVISILIIFFRKAEVEEINRKIYSAYVNIVIAQRDMSQTKVDLRQRKQSYGQYKREEILKPKLEEKKKEIRENYLSKLSNEEILKCLKSLDFRDGWTELKREARKRGIM